MKELKFERYKKIELNLLKKLRKIVNKYDPIGMYYGDNFDEYDPEIGDIYFYFKKCRNSKEFNDRVYLVFVKWFSKYIAGHKKKYFHLSEELYNILKNFYKNGKEKPKILSKR